MNIEDIVINIIREQNQNLLSDIRKLMEFSTAPQQEKPMSVKEASEYLGSSESHLYKLTSGRKIKHSKRGKRLYFLKNDLDDWMLSQKVQTREEIQDKIEKSFSKTEASNLNS